MGPWIDEPLRRDRGRDDADQRFGGGWSTARIAEDRHEQARHQHPAVEPPGGTAQNQTGATSAGHPAMKFINTSADTPLVEDRRIYAAGETAAAVAAAKIRRMNFQVVYCHECVAGPAWGSGGREETDYLHHVNLVTKGAAACIYRGRKLHMRPGYVYFFPGNTPLARTCRHGFTSFLLVFRCEWFPGIDFLLDWQDREPACLGTFDEDAWRRRLAFGPGAAVNAMLEVQSQIGLWVAAACPDLDAVITKHVDCHARFSEVFAHVERHLDAGLRVSRLARIYGGSIHAFSVAFTRTVGLSPKAFIDRHLNEKVISLLVTTDQSLQQIAAACGFGDQFHLSRHFKRLNGMSPSAYRETFFASGRPSTVAPPRLVKKSQAADRF